jgi:hypothetical protein
MTIILSVVFVACMVAIDALSVNSTAVSCAATSMIVLSIVLSLWCFVLIGVGKIPRENDGHHFFLAIPFHGIVQSHT